MLGVSHTLLSLMKNGKRKWDPELKERYDQLVTTLPNNGDETSQTETVLRGGDTPFLCVNNGGGPTGIRTQDTRIKSPMLWPN